MTIELTQGWTQLRVEVGADKYRDVTYRVLRDPDIALETIEVHEDGALIVSIEIDPILVQSQHQYEKLIALELQRIERDKFQR